MHMNNAGVLLRLPIARNQGMSIRCLGALATSGSPAIPGHENCALRLRIVITFGACASGQSTSILSERLNKVLFSIAAFSTFSFLFFCGRRLGH
jgi:hypothetical protein